MGPSKTRELLRGYLNLPLGLEYFGCHRAERCRGIYKGRRWSYWAIVGLGGSGEGTFCISLRDL